MSSEEERDEEDRNKLERKMRIKADRDFSKVMVRCELRGVRTCIGDVEDLSEELQGERLDQRERDTFSDRRRDRDNNTDSKLNSSPG
eukprot:33077-Rhodomonas_salina.7